MKNGRHDPQPRRRADLLFKKPIEPHGSQFHHDQGWRRRCRRESVGQGDGVGIVVGFGGSIADRNDGKEPFEQFAGMEVRCEAMMGQVWVMVRVRRGKSCLKQDQGQRHQPHQHHTTIYLLIIIIAIRQARVNREVAGSVWPFPTVSLR